MKRAHLFASLLLAASAVGFASARAEVPAPTLANSPARANLTAGATPVALSPTQPRNAKTLRCAAPPELTRLERSLVRTARRVAAGRSLTVVAIGSSSTAGSGASSPAASYPSRLEVMLKERFPGLDVHVLNRGVGGEEAPDMLARFDRDVIAERPDLVLWQVGTNSVLRDRDINRQTPLLREGLKRLKAIDADVVLIDPQFAPKVIAKPEASEMVQLIHAAAHEGRVGLFHRFAVMRYWHDKANASFDDFLSPDGLHMNDWSYNCLATLLGGAIAEAAGRAVQSAQAPQP